MNRLVTARALYYGLRPHLNDITLSTMEALGEYDSSTSLADEVSRNNEASRVISILVAKIYAEQIAAWEDLGALCFAIRQRARNGIFQRYLESTTNDAANFYDHIMGQASSSRIATLDEWLNLPGIEQLRGQVSGDVLTGIEYDYTNQPIHLLEVARHYRRTATEIHQLDSTRDPTYWTDRICIQLGFPTANPSSRVFTGAFNKIKHRFMVVENPRAYENPADSNPEYALLRSDPEYVHVIIAVITGAAKSIQELASLLLVLDQAGVSI